MSSDVKKLMSRLGSFRPSDRDHIARALKDANQAGAVLDAIEQFVIEWEKADWLEAYSIERIGKWIAKTQDPRITDSLAGWTRRSESEARQALAAGIKLGLSEREFA